MTVTLVRLVRMVAIRIRTIFTHNVKKRDNNEDPNQNNKKTNQNYESGVVMMIRLKRSLNIPDEDEMAP